MPDPNTITALPEAPVRGDAPEAFATKANVFLGALALLASESNLLAAWMNSTAADIDIHATTANDLYNQLNTLLAGLPDAVVDDDVASATNVYSSNKIVELLAAKLGANETASSASKLQTARTITINGDVTSVSKSFDGTGGITFTLSVKDDSHNHTIGNVDGLQNELDSKMETSSSRALNSDALRRSGSNIRIYKGDGGYESLSVGSLLASLGAGEIGTPMLLCHKTADTNITAGTNYAASNLKRVSLTRTSLTSGGNLLMTDEGAPPGTTWKAMQTADGGYEYRAVIFVRVA